jgi:hypothetical protein
MNRNELPTRARRAAGSLRAWALCWSFASLCAHGDDRAGLWRITHSVPAPWAAVVDASVAAVPNHAGQTLVLDETALRGPGPLDCAPARVELLRVSAEGLFEGNLPAPAEEAARALGIAAFPVDQVRVTCANAAFDFHHVDSQTLLLGLDNRVWTLSCAPGALAAPDAPSGVVQRLLELHYGGAMGFTPATVDAKRRFLTQALVRDTADYFDRPVPPDDVPVLNGDPFTDSQEYPTRFAVSDADVEAGSARVPVRFADAWREYVLEFHLVRGVDGWQVDDVLDREHRSLRAVLAEAP